MKPQQTKRTVWLIEQGCYSDYYVVGVFSSKVNAELVCGKIQDEYDKPKVVEWELDLDVAELSRGHTPFLVHMWRDGTVERGEPREYSGYGLEREPWLWRDRRASERGRKLVMTVLAKDLRHAVKIVNEHRVRLIAEGQWEEEDHERA